MDRFQYLDILIILKTNLIANITKVQCCQIRGSFSKIEILDVELVATECSKFYF